jgi:hypothetical protein
MRLIRLGNQLHHLLDDESSFGASTQEDHGQAAEQHMHSILLTLANTVLLLFAWPLHTAIPSHTSAMRDGYGSRWE